LSRRPSSLFRGSELPRLLFLVAIVLAGWPMIVLFSRPQAAEKPPPPSVPVAKITKIVPDEGVEFQALMDNKSIQTRESAAYAILLTRARETSAEELDRQARRDVFWTQLWERPKAFRGVPIHLEGTAKKVLSHEVGPSMSPTGRLFEVWFYSDENRAFPYVVTIEDPPLGLVIGHELNLRVTIDAYFMKLLGYQAGDVPRGAPMLVGRMHWIPAQAEPPAPMVELRNWTKGHGILLLFTLLLGYIVLRALFQIRKFLAPSRQQSSIWTTGEPLPPEEVADWLRNLPAEGPRSGEDVSSLSDEPDHLDR
jgi:hypothetical protein